MDLALASIRQVAEGEEWDGKVTLLDKAEMEPMEKLERVERLEPSDYEKFGFPKQKREVTDEQFDLDTKEIFDDNAEAIGEGFYKKMARFNELMACWKTLPNYDPDFSADLPWLEENVAHYLDQRERKHPVPAATLSLPSLGCAQSPQSRCRIWAVVLQMSRGRMPGMVYHHDRPRGAARADPTHTSRSARQDHSDPMQMRSGSPHEVESQ